MWMRFSLCLLALSASALHADELEDFENAPPPTFAWLKSVDVEAGTFTYADKVSKPVYETRTAEVIEDGKKVVKAYAVERMVSEMREHQGKLADFRVVMARGRKVEPAELKESVGQVVVLAPTEKGVHKIYRDMLNAKTLVLTNLKPADWDAPAPAAPQK